VDLFIKENEVVEVVFHIRTGSGSKKLGRAKLELNVDKEILRLSRTSSIALIELYSPLATINSDEPRARITGIVDALLLRRAQMFQ
jgi:hypothetical protein